MSFKNISFNSGYWKVIVQIPTNGISLSPVESLGYYDTEQSAKKALSKYKAGGLLDDSNKAIIKALRIRAAAAEAILNRRTV